MINLSNNLAGPVNKFENDAVRSNQLSETGKSDVRWSQSRPAGINEVRNSAADGLSNGLIGAYNRGNFTTRTENFANRAVPQQSPFARFSNESGFVRGDRFSVNGPLWFDGYGVVDRLDDNAASFRINIRVPSIASQVFNVVDKKINVSFGIGEYNNGRVNLYITDHNKNNYTQRFEAVLREGMKRTSGGLFGSDKLCKSYEISTINNMSPQGKGKLGLLIAGKGEVQLQLQLPPYLDNSLDLKKM